MSDRQADDRQVVRAGFTPDLQVTSVAAGAAAARQMGTLPDCCTVSRRALVGTLVASWALGAVQTGQSAPASRPSPMRNIRLAFCGQLLCVVPYEVARAHGLFEAEGLNVELVYTRGGSAAMQALVGGAVDYAATSFDVALQAFARGAGIVRFLTTGRLPLFALATAPRTAGQVRELRDLAGRTVGISAPGNADHVLLRYLLARAGVDPKRVEFAALGTNLFEAVRVGHVDAGMVQEPALSLLTESGGRVLVNFMDLADSTRYLGGPYEFMGVAVRRGEFASRRPEMLALGRALERALKFIHQAPASESIQALPKALVAGGDVERLAAALERHRRSLYPETVRIDPDATRRVVESHELAGLLPAGFSWGELLDQSVGSELYAAG